MKKQSPAERHRTVVLWVMAVSGWTVILCVIGVSGLKTLWGEVDRAIDPPPEGGEEIVAKLEQYEAKHHRYPKTLEEAGIPPAENVRYVHCGAQVNEYVLRFAIPDVNDDVWTYTSWNREWSHWKMSSGG